MRRNLLRLLTEPVASAPVFSQRIEDDTFRLFRSVRRHSSEIVFGVLVIVFRGDCVAALGFSSGECQIPLIISLRIGRTDRCVPGG